MPAKFHDLPGFVFFHSLKLDPYLKPFTCATPLDSRGATGRGLDFGLFSEIGFRPVDLPFRRCHRKAAARSC